MTASFQSTASLRHQSLADQEGWKVPVSGRRSRLRPRAIVDNSSNAH
jgi:hypothetical protein